MARQKTQVEYNNFTNGFITEANPLSFPENAAIDELNININNDGSRQRRFGMEWTASAYDAVQSVRLSDFNFATSSYAWLSAGNDGDQNLGVFQIGRDLYFFDLDEEDPSSMAALVQTVTLSSVMTDTDTPFTYTSAYGKLVIACGTEWVTTCSFDGATVTVDQFRLEVRDRWGIADGFEIDERPVTSNNLHLYNLYNQGWETSTKLVGDETALLAPTTGDPVAFTKTSIGVYPSNVDLMWAAKAETINPGGAWVNNIGAFSPWELIKNHYGTTPAPQGNTILDIFKRNGHAQTPNRSSVTGLTGLTTDYHTGSVSSVSTFAGRLWYTLKEDSLTGGDDLTPQIGNMVLYSQATEDYSRWKACHTKNDPAAETFNDILASDGGFISIPEAGQIYRTVPLGESLFVLASNGAWEIYGGDTSFSGTEQSVQKISDAGTVNGQSVVIGNNFIGYWSDEGIYGINISQTSLRGEVTNITETTIQDFYDEIPEDRKRFVSGSYDKLGRKALWLYSSSDKGSDYYFNKELVYDVLKGSFTKRDILAVDNTDGPWVTTALSSLHKVTDVTIEDVTDGGVTVTDSGVDVTVVLSDAEQKTKSSMYYWTAEGNGSGEHLRVSAYLNTDFIDYSKVDSGVDAAGYLVTGYLTGGDSSRIKWFPYISVKSHRTESGWTVNPDGSVDIQDESSCTMQTQWEWTNSALSGKWGRAQEVYRLPRFQLFDDDALFAYDVVNTRNKIRGSGRALSLKFSTSPGKDMHLLGWGMEVSVKEEV